MCPFQKVGPDPNEQCHPTHAHWNGAAPSQARGRSAQPWLYQQYVPRQRPENLLIRVGLWVGQKQVSTRCNEPKQQREHGEEMNAELRNMSPRIKTYP